MEMLINTLFPVFGIILLGYVASKLHLLSPSESAILNKFVYFIAFPSLLFVVMATAPMEKIFYWEFLGAWGLGLGITFLLTTVVSLYIWRDPLPTLSINSLNTTCSSTAFMGVPLLLVAFGQDAALAAIVATTFLVAIVISLSIFLIELKQVDNSVLLILKKIIVSLSHNPLMIGAVLGILVSASVQLPESVSSLFDLLGKAAIPISLFSIGLFIAGQSVEQIKEGLFKVHVLTFIKLFLHPAITWILIELFFDLNAEWTAITVLLAGLPPATTCFVLAQRYEVGVSTTASMTVISTIYSLFTISVLLLLFSS
ncbi:MAG: AEC family transporter [Cellvibrionaceae bacterium]